MSPENTRVVLHRLRDPASVVIERGAAPTPGPGEVRIRVEAAGVSQADVTIRQGMYPVSAPLPFVLGYDLVGVIDAVGPGVTARRVGERVAAITVRGAWATFVCWPADDVYPVPAQLDAARAVALVLNYVTAYQLFHRVAKVRRGETILVHSAAGGVGTALLELARLQQARALGTASAGKAALVRELGGEPIDYRSEDFVARARAIGGVDAVFDGIGGNNFSRSFASLRRGGRFLGYGFQTQMDRPLWGRIDTFARFLGMKLLPRGRSAHFYGIMFMKKDHPEWFREDLATLFAWHAEGKLEPRIADRMPLTEAVRALERVERGELLGKLVLVPG